MTGDLADRIAQSNALQAVAAWAVKPLERPCALRMTLARHATVQAFELHGAITLLLANGFAASAHALLRPLMESVYRALWLVYAARFEEVQRLRDGQHSHTIHDLLRDLRKRTELMQLQVLHDLQGTLGTLFNSFAHSSHEALSRRSEGFSEDELISCAFLSDMFFVIAMDAAAVIHDSPLLKALMDETSRRLLKEASDRFHSRAEPQQDALGLPPAPVWNDPESPLS